MWENAIKTLNQLIRIDPNKYNVDAYKKKVEELKDFTPLTPDGYLTFNIVHVINNGKVYHGVTETNLNIILGDIGDTLIIRCNKNNPQYSVFQYPDNPDLRVRKLTGKEYYRILYQEPDENNNP